MRVFLRVLISVMVCVLAVGYASAQAAKSADRDAIIATAEKELMQADRDFCADWQKNGSEAWARWFAEHGVEDTGAGPAVGPEAVRKNIAETYGPGSNLTWTPDEARAMEDGRMGLTRGHFIAALNANGKKMEIRGQYITIWRKQKDGSWRIVWDGGEALH
ncbi:MAG TPA: nuclear transport factor 2 family protein [Candidatus Acidoferrales bacterium]|nr:nuclear transport factor 2 family protein [Candidatus Acidoferrales bacterium]